MFLGSEEASPDRTEARCVHVAEGCGGCDWQHVTVDAQRELRRAMVSDVLATHARKNIFGYRMMVWAIVGIGGLSFFVWAHHMYVSGMDPTFGFFFATTTLIIAVPTAIKVTLGDGTSYTNVVSSSTTFLGFFSSSGPISSISISAIPAPGTSGNVYPTLDNMTFAVVPAPSVIALFGIAGACGRRRRA